MKFRLVDAGRTTEFNAATQLELARGIRAGIFKLWGTSPRWRHIMIELQVATDSGEWLSPNYPESAQTMRCSINTEINSRIWALCARANQRGTWFEHEMANISRFILE